MDESTATPGSAAPAQPAAPAAPATQSATHAAVASGDASQYREARRAERIGKPLPDVQATPTEPAADAPAPTPAAPTPTVSKRQEDINNRIREAVERATADKDAEIARLRGTSPAAPAPAPKADVAKVPEWKRYAGMPESPKLADFDSVEEHSAAMALFIADKRHDERQTEASQRTDMEQIDAVQRARAESFHAKLDAAKTADPEFVTKLSPEVKALKPISGLAPGEASGPLNILWERVYDSPHMDKLLLHFSQHPDALRQFETLPPEIAKLPPALRVRAHIPVILEQFGELVASLKTPAAAPARPQPKTLTDAPANQALGSRPAEAADPKAGAIRKGDTSAYRRLRREERVAAMR